MPKIYTKTGDNGKTSLFGGKRVGKHCIALQVIGEIDELNSTIGLAVAFMAHPRNDNESLSVFFFSIQRDLFKAGAELALAQGAADVIADKVDKIGMSCVKALEDKIDEYWKVLPSLRQFILPGGNLAAAHLHQARAICRRAERALAAFAKEQTVRPELQIYLNRLSDFLFAAARWVNFAEGVEETKV